MFHKMPTDTGDSAASPTNPPKYFTLPNDEGSAFYALFTQHANLNFFAPDQYPIHLQINDETYNQARLSEPILVRKTTKNKKFHVVLDQTAGSGAEGTIIVLGATFRLNMKTESAEVKFTNYVVKHSVYTLDKKTIHETKLKREQAFTRIGAPVLRMKEPILIDKFDSEHTGSGFLVMKQLFGEDLHKVIENQYSQTPDFPKLSTADLLELILKIGDRIQDLHEEKRLVHRDLKPANIFITNDLQVQPIDFGFTKHVGEVDSKLVGSPTYVDPFLSRLLLTRQLDGYTTWPEEKKRNLLTEKSEMFIFGLIIAELLNITPPITGDAKTMTPMQLSYNRNCNIVLDAEKVNLPELKKSDIVELIGLVNHLFNIDPEKRPDAKTFMLLLRGHLESILKQLTASGYKARTQLKDIPFVTDEIKLKSLKSLLLFKPVEVDASGSGSSNDSFIPRPELLAEKENPAQAKAMGNRAGLNKQY